MKMGLLFDLDGTLVDTEANHFAAFVKVLAGFGVGLDLATYAKRVMGFPNAMIAADFLPHLPPAEGLAALMRKEAAYRDSLGALELAPGALALLDFADARGIACALVTNAPRANAELVLGKLGIAGRFKTLVIADDLARSKPDPLPYLEGLRRLGVAADASLAFEDSRSGVRSALAAGIATVGMMTTLGAAEMLGLGAALAARDFSDVRIYGLVAERVGKWEVASGE